MGIVGIYANYLNPEHIAQIENVIYKNNYQIRYFNDLQEVEQHIHECEIIYGYYPAYVLKKATGLRWFASASAGVDPFLKDE
ncbi:MAG: hypothetical protein IKL38_05085, partial [Firmicutes bacterium]|nr:hypothetical protein [Bacillota bacterium]